MKRAVCLVSGGMDSFVTAAMAREKGYSIIAMTVSYGQKNRREILSAKRICGFLEAEKHKVVEIDLSWADSALTREDIPLPAGGDRKGIPETYVPARNTIFISLALALAETEKAGAIYIGVNSVDFSGYPDCRPEYIKRFQALIDVATRKTSEGGRIMLETPLLYMSKSRIILEGIRMGLDLGLTWSCYAGGDNPCGSCPSCELRKKGFTEAGLQDPLLAGIKPAQHVAGSSGRNGQKHNTRR